MVYFAQLITHNPASSSFSSPLLYLTSHCVVVIGVLGGSCFGGVGLVIERVDENERLEEGECEQLLDVYKDGYSGGGVGRLCGEVPLLVLCMFGGVCLLHLTSQLHLLPVSVENAALYIPQASAVSKHDNLI